MSKIRIAGKTLEEIRDYREVWFLCDLDETAMEIAEEVFENILPALVEMVERLLKENYRMEEQLIEDERKFRKITGGSLDDVS